MDQTLGGDLKAALAGYEEAMRPMVDKVQGVLKIGPRMMNPHRRLGIHLLHARSKSPAVRQSAP